MKTKKRKVGIIVAIVFIVVVLLGALLFDFFYGNNQDKWVAKEVSTAAELQKGGTNIKLTNDIDFGGEVFEAIEVNNFDGGGYTISNAIITSSQLLTAASFFSCVGGTVQNVTFKNITVSAEDVPYAAVVLAYPTQYSSFGTVDEIIFNNVHVIDCTITLQQNGNEATTYVGGILGSGTAVRQSSTDNSFWHESDDMKKIIRNSSVQNLQMTVNGFDPESDGTYVIGEDIYVGGLSGSADEITNCKVTDCNISVTSYQRFSDPYVGGAVGLLSNSGESFGCIIKGNILNVRASNYRHVSLTNQYETSTIYLGGLFGASGSDGNISYCNIDSNSFSAYCAGAYYLGGIGGSVSKNISQSRVVNNTFNGVGMLDGEDKYGDPWTRNIGGISASSAVVTFSSSFTYGNTMKTILSLDTGESSDPKGSAVGFSKKNQSAIFINCATGINELEAGTTDEFATAALENITQCYVTQDIYGNEQQLTIINESDWLSQDSIVSLLKLSGDLWQFRSGALPDIQ